MKYNKYLNEIKSVKDDNRILTRDGLYLTLTPIINQFDLPTGDNDSWVFQHWRAMPKPKLGRQDQREFGYFIQSNGKLIYKIIPAEKLVVKEGIKLVPLQWRGCFVPGRVPTAGNYFPNSEIVLDSLEATYYLKGI